MDLAKHGIILKSRYWATTSKCVVQSVYWVE